MLRRLGQYLGLGRAAAANNAESSAPPPAPGLPPPSPLDTPVAGSTAADRQRLHKTPLSPVLARHTEGGRLEAAIADVRLGRPAVATADREEWRTWLRGFRKGELNELREVLVNRPPHKQLKVAAGHASLKGPATVDGVLAILTGEVFGWSPRAQPPSAHVKGEVHALATRLLKAEEQARWLPILTQSAPLANLFVRIGPPVLEMARAFGVAFTERIDAEWGARQILSEVARERPSLLPELEQVRRQLGDDAFLLALERLDEGALRARISRNDLYPHLSGAELVAVGQALGKDLHDTLALRVAVGSAGVLELCRKGAQELGRRLREEGSKVAAFGANDAPLYKGAQWPVEPSPSLQLQRAEQRLSSSFNLAAGVQLGSPQQISPATLGRLIQAMTQELTQRSPEKAALLERELLGRRFVSYRYYDGLYEQGVKNPEHRYSVRTFESWSEAAQKAAQAGKGSRGRPLRPGELTALMQEFQAAAGRGMVEAHESHLKTEDLGRLRDKDEDHVQLGDAFHHLDTKTAEILDRNPYLLREDAWPDGKGQVVRRIAFAPGSAVPKMVAELDQWVRDQEAAGRDPVELAAAVHHRLVSIHPFMDGNGRTSKLVADFLLARAGIPPPVWRDGEVLVHVDRWPQVMQAGIHFHYEVVLRHWRAAQAAEGPS